MIEREHIYRRVQELFSGQNYNFSVIEDPIDVNLQIKYFELASRVNRNHSEDEMLAREKELFDPKLPLNMKRKLLVKMAGVPSPKIYRIIENYSKNADEMLADWAKIALQDNKLVLESELLETNRHVIITTGLGGKGHKLRYFVVLINKVKGELKPYQQKIVQDEMQHALQSADGELEKLEFFDKYATMRMVLPLTADIALLLRNVVIECNQFGDFIAPDFIVTNMCELSEKDISTALKNRNYHEDDDNDFEFPPVY